MAKLFDKIRNTPDEEAVKKKAKAAREQYEKQTGQAAPVEEGLEELDFEDMIPGGSVLTAVTPVGAGKTTLKNIAKKAMPAARNLLEHKTPRAAYWSGNKAYEAYKKAYEKAKAFGKDTQAVADAFNAKVLEAEVDYLTKVQKKYPEIYNKLVYYFKHEAKGKGPSDPEAVKKTIAETTQHYGGLNEILTELAEKYGDDL